MNNPSCHWNGCYGSAFNSLFELLKHVDCEHAFNEDQSAPVPSDNKIYKCKWDKCNVNFWKKKDTFTEAYK